MASDELRLLVGVPETIAVEHCTNCGAIRNLSRASRPLSGRADRYNIGFLIKQKELTSIPVLRYGSDHRKRWFKNPIQSRRPAG
jgi:hypothetical protein